MIRTWNHDLQPAAIGESIINGADVHHGVADRFGGIRRVGGFSTMIAQDKHEWLSDTFPDNTAEGSPVHVDARLASGIVMAELEGGGATERVAEHSDPLHVESSLEP